LFAAAGYIFPLVARAGEAGQWLITLRLDEPLDEGARIRLSLDPRSDWKPPQVSRDGRMEYWRARILNGEELPAQVPKFKPGDAVQVEFLMPRSLTEGDVVQIEIGGITGATPQTFSQNRMVINIEIDRKGERNFEPIRESPALRVIGGEPKRLRVIVPSVVKVGEGFRVLLRAEDEFGNTATRYTGTVELEVGGETLSLAFAPDDRGVSRVEGVKFDDASVHRIVARDAEGGMETVSNPALVEESDEGERIFWGVLHGHTELSDGMCRPEEYFAFARDEAGLDFCALTDHDRALNADKWEMARALVESLNESGRFVTFLGYEWCGSRGGHKCVYFRDGGRFFSGSQEEHATPRRLFEALRAESALVIPVHTASVLGSCDWSEHEPQLERLVEIYSVWGSSELPQRDGNPFPLTVPWGEYHRRRWWQRKSGEVESGLVVNGLRAGCRLGFTAGGGDHTGHPGARGAFANLPVKYCAGLTAVYSRALSREALWQALSSRRCYATTGARMILQFSVGGCTMGGEIALDDELARKRVVKCRAIGEAPIEGTEIIRNGEVAHSRRGCRSEEAQIEWTDETPFDSVSLKSQFHDGEDFVFYYARVFQYDGEVAWASPVWVVRKG